MCRLLQAVLKGAGVTRGTRWGEGAWQADHPVGRGEEHEEAVVTRRQEARSSGGCTVTFPGPSSLLDCSTHKSNKARPVQTQFRSLVPATKRLKYVNIICMFICYSVYQGRRPHCSALTHFLDHSAQARDRSRTCALSAPTAPKLYISIICANSGSPPALPWRWKGGVLAPRLLVTHSTHAKPCYRLQGRPLCAATAARRRRRQPRCLQQWLWVHAREVEHLQVTHQCGHACAQRARGRRNERSRRQRQCWKLDCMPALQVCKRTTGGKEFRQHKG